MGGYVQSNRSLVHTPVTLEMQNQSAAIKGVASFRSLEGHPKSGTSSVHLQAPSANPRSRSSSFCNVPSIDFGSTTQRNAKLQNYVKSARPSRKRRPFKYSLSEALKLNDYEVFITFVKFMV